MDATAYSPERDRDRNRQPVSVCVFPDRVFLFLLLIFLCQFIPLSSPFEALDDERFNYNRVTAVYMDVVTVQHVFNPYVSTQKSPDSFVQLY
jgi:hypothetical protein